MRLCHIDDLPDGGARGFDLNDARRDTIFVVRQDKVLYAYENACPHHGTSMPWRKDGYLNATGRRIVCFAHGAEFEIDTGRCTLGPCLGQSLTPVALRLDGAGGVHLATRQTSSMETKS